MSYSRITYLTSFSSSYAAAGLPNSMRKKIFHARIIFFLARPCENHYFCFMAKKNKSIAKTTRPTGIGISMSELLKETANGMLIQNAKSA